MLPEAQLEPKQQYDEAKEATTFTTPPQDAIQDDSNLQALLLLHSDAPHHPTASSLDHPLLEAMSKQQHNKVLQNDIYSGIDCSKQDSLSDISITPDIFLTGSSYYLLSHQSLILKYRFVTLCITLKHCHTTTAEELAKYASKLAQEGTGECSGA